MFFFIVKLLIYSVVEFVEFVEWFFAPQKSTVEVCKAPKKREPPPSRAAALYRHI